jgi:hypothetical protein
LKEVENKPLKSLSREQFVCAWSSVAYLYSGMHPDSEELAGPEWPPMVGEFAAEAWRRADRGEITDEELYPSDAQWAGLYDQLIYPTREEAARRAKLARREQA